MTLVLDASALVQYLARGEQAEKVGRAILNGAGGLWAPHLIDAEIGHVLRRGVQRGELDAARARTALHELGELPLQRVAHGGLLLRAWEMRENLSFYDALYASLAERLDAVLITLDARIERAPGVRARVEVIA
ncbi:MAG TPA: type II toxin-antitoxin system VapC family toxin [Solirubrobacteraceae bacterium]|nr:type II toxin-antitoxin system VapC family toxin [Solirubrobacteraceae bacterium]